MKNSLPSEMYRRNLPHIHRPNSVLFVTSRLDGTLPLKVVLRLKEERDIYLAEIDDMDLSEEEKKAEITTTHRLYFGKFDKLLDTETCGPTWLKDDKVAKIVTDALMHFDEERYKIVCYTVMSNHIHIIFHKLDRKLSLTMQNYKSYTGTMANRYLDRVGEKFWAQENYDRYLRNRNEFIAKVKYVLDNPVQAGLVSNWEDWPHSYLREEYRNIVFPK